MGKQWIFDDVALRAIYARHTTTGIETVLNLVIKGCDDKAMDEIGDCTLEGARFRVTLGVAEEVDIAPDAPPTVLDMEEE